MQMNPYLLTYAAIILVNKNAYEYYYGYDNKKQDGKKKRR